MTKAPKHLEADGRKLWRWADMHFEIGGVEPLLGELCAIADRLAAIRVALFAAAAPDTRLIAAETKLLSQYRNIWRLLGLADSTEPKRKVGRPPGVPLRKVG